MVSVFSSLEQWLGDQIVPVVFLGFAVLAGLALLYLSAQSGKAAKRRDRSGRTEESFADQLAAHGFDPEIARTAYRYLQMRRGVSFPIEPMDDLDRDLGLDGDEVKESVQDLLRELGREYLPGMLTTPLVTVVDLVRFLQSSPRKVLPMRSRSA
ncbi:MAG TPA: hypothetical protein VG714_10955 [Acidobacteriaceae bacterium]|nr:hypothetical protein [Acidobacteriaceae bacterium]